MKRAAAVQYRKGDVAPFVLAQGRGDLAEKMISIANDYGIETVEDEDLVERLFLVETGSPIPESLFEAVAALLAYVYRTRSTT